MFTVVYITFMIIILGYKHTNLLIFITSDRSYNNYAVDDMLSSSIYDH